MTSAVESNSATLGCGSNVCELVPSGTMPAMSARSPTMLATMLVIGATVVATSKRSSFIAFPGHAGRCWTADATPIEPALAARASAAPAITRMGGTLLRVDP